MRRRLEWSIVAQGIRISGSGVRTLQGVGRVVFVSFIGPTHGLKRGLERFLLACGTPCSSKLNEVQCIRSRNSIVVTTSTISRLTRSQYAFMKSMSSKVDHHLRQHQDAGRNKTNLPLRAVE